MLQPQLHLDHCTADLVDHGLEPVELQRRSYCVTMEAGGRNFEDHPCMLLSRQWKQNLDLHRTSMSAITGGMSLCDEVLRCIKLFNDEV